MDGTPDRDRTILFIGFLIGLYVGSTTTFVAEAIIRAIF